jgi:hypothetical protein
MNAQLLVDRKMKRMLVNILSIFVMLALALSATRSAYAAGPWYVAPNGNDGNDCLSSATPCGSINGAIAKASSNDTINIAAGVYTSTETAVVLLGKSLTLSGGWNTDFSSQQGMSILDGQLSRRGMIINADVNTNIERFEITNAVGQSSGGGGGMMIGNNATVILSDSLIHNVQAYGGIFAWYTDLTLIRTTISDSIDQGVTNYLGTLRMISSAVTGNTYGIVSNGNTLIENSTISGNLHGGIALDCSGTIDIRSSTVTDNHDFGLRTYWCNTATIQNTILAGNIDTTHPDCTGPLQSAGYNIVGSTQGCDFTATTGDLTNTNASLANLQNNGGPTQTHALLSDSPAIDAGNPNGCTDSTTNVLVTDQRGEARILDGNGDGNAVCDIGAYEAGEVPESLNPWFTAFPNQEVVEGWDWPLDAVVHMTIDDPSTADSPDFQQDATVTYTPWGSNQLWVWFDFAGVYDMKLGDVVTLTDGTTPRTHVVQNLSISTINPDENTVSGIANAGQPVIVWSWEDTEGNRLETTANDSGIWTVDFDDVNFDLVIGNHVRAEVWVDRNDTAVDQDIRNPHFTVFPEWEWFDGLNWPDGSSVTITVAGKPECETVKESWGGFFNGSFGAGCDLVIGDTVTFTDGVTTRTHTVQNLAIKSVNAKNDTIKGIASPGTEVYVWPHATGQQQLATTDAEGIWKVSFAGVFDLVPGEAGRSEIRDEFENATAVDWYVPNPRFTVFPEWEWFDGMDWADGEKVTITVAGKPECKVRKTSWGSFFNGSFGEGCDVVPGDTVTFKSGMTTRIHVVQDLAITAVDAAADTITGTADAGAIVNVWPHATGQQLQATADSTGNWQADFTEVFDLVPGECGRSQINDAVGNATAVDWCMPNPRFGVRANVDQVEGWEWTEGETVTLTADDPDTGGIDYTATQTVGLAPWDPNQTYVSFNLWNVYNIQPGDVVSLSNGSFTKTTTVTNLAFTDIDVDHDVVTGIAAPNSHVDIWACENASCINRHVDADGGGVWIADFGNAGAQGDEQNTFNIVLATWIDSSQNDEDGDQTFWGQNVPNPYIEAAPFSDWVHAREWPIGTLMTLEIDDPSDGLGDVDYSATATMGQAPWNPNDPNDIVADFRWPDEFAPGPGYVLTMSGNGQSKTLTITNLSITNFDLEADTVSGTGTPNAQIQVCANIPNRCITRWVTPDKKGNWKANYGVPGTGKDDPDTFDVQQGSNGWAAEYDADSDRTWFDWWVPNPRIVASVTEDWFYVNDFIPNATLNYSVYESQGGRRLSEGTALTDSSGYVWVNADGRWNLEPGNYLVISDGTSTKDLVVEGITFDVFDLTNGRLIGTAPEPYGRTVWVGIGWQYQDTWAMDVVTDENGDWIADFGKPVPGDYWWVAAQIFDADGDASEVRPSNVINWTLVIGNQPDWVDSGIPVSAGQSFTVQALGLMNPCSDTYPNGDDICIFYTPVGAEWVVPYENEFGIFPGPALRFIALLGRIGDGEPFYIGEGGTFTAEQDGTLWFTPNDNLRTDNQGAYSLLVSTEP